MPNAAQSELPNADDETLLDPLVRAVVLARGLRASFDLDAQNVAYLLERWRARHGQDIPRERLQLVVRMVFTDPPPAPLSKQEAARLITAAVEAFRETPELGRQTVRAWCARRGGVTATQVQRLVERFTDAVRPPLDGVDCAA